mgnify:CR=1 FL=1
MTEKKEKHIKAKPSFYAYCFKPLKEIAKKYGYNLVMHGSLDRDFDLIAIGWVENLKDDFKMIQEMDMFLNGKQAERKEDYGFSVIPPNRNSYVINLNRGGHWNNYEDEQWYVDISVI